MKQYQALFTKIKLLLNMDVKFEQARLEDGSTMIEAESFEVGEAVFIVADDGNIPLPEGSYTLEDGRELVVMEEGVIGALNAPAAAEEAEEAEMGKDAVTREEFNKLVEAVAALTDQGAELAKEETKEEATEAVEASKEAEEAEKPEAVEMASEVEKTEEAEKVELAEEPVKPIQHNPEREADTKFNIQLQSNRPNSTLDVVMSKIAAIKH